MKYTKVQVYVSEQIDGGLYVSFGGDFGNILDIDNNLSYDENRNVQIPPDGIVKLHAILGEIIAVKGWESED